MTCFLVLNSKLSLGAGWPGTEATARSAALRTGAGLAASSSSLSSKGAPSALGCVSECPSFTGASVSSLDILALAACFLGCGVGRLYLLGDFLS